MNTIYLAYRNLITRPLTMLLTLLLFALGIGLTSFLWLVNSQLQTKFEKNLANIDMVVGAKGSPLQLILCNMYHIDNPTGNIPLKAAEPFMNPRHPFIKKAIPLSLGDSYQSFRIVGTTPDFLELYNANLKEGKIWEKAFDVVIGSDIAQKTGLKLGQTFQSSHGFINDTEMEHHDVPPFKVVGILQPSDAVVDQLVLTNAESIWKTHEHEEETQEEHEEGEIHHDHTEIADSNRAITSLLIQFKGRNAQTLNFQRNINENTDLQAATPAIEIQRLYLMMGVGEDTLRALALLIIGVSALSIFIALFNSLKERKYELALMRVMGAKKSKLFGLIVSEGLILSIVGFLLGILVSHTAMQLLAGYLEQLYRYHFEAWTWLSAEWLLLGCSLLIGLLAALIPAFRAYRTNISTTLGES